MNKGDRLTINGVEVYVTWHSRDGRAFDVAELVTDGTTGEIRLMSTGVARPRAATIRGWSA